jgi:hypothetical protein
MKKERFPKHATTTTGRPSKLCGGIVFRSKEMNKKLLLQLMMMMKRREESKND